MLLRNQDERLLKALVVLQGQPEFRLFLEWLDANRSLLLEDIAEQVIDVKLRQTQGAIQVLAAIARSVREARIKLPS